jgi:serine/threonine protein kinase
MLSLEDIGWWMWDAISGVAHMHHVEKDPFLHRDLKLQNLLVTGLRRVKVADMGLAVRVQPGRMHHSSGPGTGTPLTMAPQAQDGKYDAAGDVYSWAMCVCLAIQEAFHPATRGIWGKRKVRELLLLVLACARVRLRGVMASTSCWCAPPWSWGGGQVIHHGIDGLQQYPDIGALVSECLHENNMQRPCAVEARDRLCAALLGVRLRTCGHTLSCSAAWRVRLDTEACSRMQC